MGICFGILEEDKQEDNIRNASPIQDQASEGKKEEEITYQLENFTFNKVVFVAGALWKVLLAEPIIKKWYFPINKY
ncbi:unnamed protein product (macronuclear) [Paramecium tetraurelia]|uniref:Uncharacterized protein n=1 Tax=Paramecium tetraurelia TaxID=5888 RepID=A0CRG0_PARTE|nr:uncharacterized protein GSPATT00009692001 [Paramecium tetraurelia]CAK73377.1 unnamed protein product [Paramecium tetraurelia]|eukprot:XP_001440774.1 hypothetical protein (macronuclear) [Paramecium tetraurelia strain d4-2]